MWTSKSVTDELIRAYEVLFAMPGRPGPKAGGAWPSYADDEVSEQLAAALAKPKPRRHNSPSDIQRMETALIGKGNRAGWLKEHLGRDRGAIRCLALYAIWSAAGVGINDGCRRKHWSYSTFNNRRKKAAQIVADALNAEESLRVVAETAARLAAAERRRAKMYALAA